MERFAFGRNWLNYFDRLTELDRANIQARIAATERELQEKLQGSLSGKRFLDVGCGSGLMSLAAQNLGARVHSFDYDPQSVQCTHQMREKFGRPTNWDVEQGSALDPVYLTRLGTFDVVYSWGVLHHTGDMWQALKNLIPLVAPGGQLFIALYNDQGWRSRYWTFIKRHYNASSVARKLIILFHLPLLLARYVGRALTGRLTLERGMLLWSDYLDWLGGYPFEVATHDQVVAYFRDAGFSLTKSTRATSGCNEFVFARNDAR